MAPRRPARRSAPYASARSSLRLANIREGSSHGSDDMGMTLEVGASTPGTSTEGQSTLNSSVSVDEFHTLQKSVQEMRALMEQMTANFRQMASMNNTQVSPAAEAIPRSTVQGVEGTASQPASLEATIDEHINHIIQGNVVANDSIDPSPQGHYINLDRPLDTRISDKVRDKIWSKQYVDLNTLVDTHTDDSQTLHIVSGVGEPLRLAPHKPDNKINSLGKWTDAFLVYVTVYARKYPHEVSKLTAYIQLIKRLALKGGDFLFYDREFRYLRQNGHSGWDVHLDLWLEARDFRGNATNFSHNKPTGNQYNKSNNNNTYRNNKGPFRGQPRNDNKSPHPMGYCFRYHSTGRCNNFAACAFKHICYHPGCGAKHPISNCPKRGGAYNAGTAAVSSKQASAPATK